MLLAFLFITAAFRYGEARTHSPVEPSTGLLNQVMLPIEVMGPDGHVESVTLHVGDPAGVDSMYLVGHALGYHNSRPLWEGEMARDEKASYRVNGGEWRPISNSHASVRLPERDYLGIGGAYHTVRLTVPVEGIGAGDNTVEFRFNATEGISSGYRILELDLLGPGGVSRIDGTAFRHEDPELWTAPAGYGNAASIAAGEALWHQREILKENPLEGAPTLVASCSDCHATSGYDLKYFNYSNTSITTRATFHGLSEEEANQIAAYIRSIDLDRADGRETSPHARPWNPPYQPGPGLLSRGGSEAVAEDDWSAGAGLDWVLNDDADTFDYMFSEDGVTPNPAFTDADIARVLHVGTYDGDDFGNPLPIQEIPVAIQYPDWNNWLPDIHPFDAFGYEDFMGEQLWSDYLAFAEAFDTQTERDAAVADTRSKLAQNGGRSLLHKPQIKFNFEFDSWGPAQSLFDYNYDSDPVGYYLGKLSFMQWEAVKSWEVYNRYDMQSLGNDVGAGLVLDTGEPGAGEPVRWQGSKPEHGLRFSWPGEQAVVFNLAPHKHGEPGFAGEGAYSPPGHPVMQYYFSTAWYDLQLVLSDENNLSPSTNGSNPTDWAYMAALLGDTENSSGRSHFARLVRQRVFAWQSRNNRYSREDVNRPGSFSDRVPTNMYKLFGTNAAFPNSWSGALHRDQGEAQRVLFGALDEWVEYLKSVSASMWSPRVEANNKRWEPPTYVPGYRTDGDTFQQPDWADNVYEAATLAAEEGYYSTADALARWGEQMWPLGDWEQWFIDEPPPVEPVQQAIQLEPGWNLISSYVAPSDSAMATIWQPLADHATVIRDALGYEFNPSQGTGTLEYWRRGEGYQVYMTEPAVLTLQGELITPEATPLSLHEGWNQVAYLGTSQAPVAEAFTGILSNLVAVKKNDGAMFMPEFEVDQIGLLSPGQGYKLLLADDAVLVYPPNSEGGRIAPARGITPPQGQPAGERRADRMAAPQGRTRSAGAQ